MLRQSFRGAPGSLRPSGTRRRKLWMRTREAESWQLALRRRVIAEATGATRASGVGARCLSGVLRLCSIVYGAANQILDTAYASGLLRPVRLPLPVISVGNVTWGGSGKTPMAIFLAHLYHAQGLRPLVLTRGYGGDEDKLLCRQLAGVAGVGSGADRAAVAAHMLSQAASQAPPLPAGARCMHLDAEEVDGTQCSAVEKSSVDEGEKTLAYDVVILDDGLQHRKLVRDGHVLMINCLDPSLVHCDACNDDPNLRQERKLADCQLPVLRGELMPVGTLREGIEPAVRKAHVIVLHNADLLPAACLSALHDHLAELCSGHGVPRGHDQLSQTSEADASAGRRDGVGSVGASPDVVLTRAQISEIRPLTPSRNGPEKPDTRGGAGKGQPWWWGDEGHTCSGGVPVLGRTTSAAEAIISHRRPVDPSRAQHPNAGTLHGKRVVAVAGVANPTAFFRQVDALGPLSVVHAPFPDHHAFSSEELCRLLQRSLDDAAEGGVPRAGDREDGTGQGRGVVTMITTAKDECRSAPAFRETLARCQPGDVEVLVMETRLRVLGDGAAAESALRRLVRRNLDTRATPVDL